MKYRNAEAMSKQNVEKCPVCGEKEFNKIGQDVSENIYPVKGDMVYLHPSFCIKECKRCFLYYKSDIPSFDLLNKYYENIEISYENTDFLFPTDVEVIKEINNLIGKDIRILDYGCGSGRILKELNNDFQKIGVEINSDAIKIAKERGIEIIDEQTLEEYKSHFDVVILSDVFEHLYKPLELLEKLANTLKKGGFIIIVTGNSDAIKLKENTGGYWYFQLFSHLQMLNKKHLEWLKTELHLSIKKMVSCSHYSENYAEKLKSKIAEILFRLYKKIPQLPVWKVSKLKKVTKWKYPIFDTANKDHLVIILNKD